MSHISIIIPSRNEATGLKQLLPELKTRYPEAEVIVVDDGSEDGTADIGRNYGAKVVTHPYSMGNGAAVKSGARAAKGDILIFMDGDGQHSPEEISRLLAKLEEGFDMIVGVRSAHAGFHRAFGNQIYNKLASLMTGYRIEDLTSGFRAVRANKFRKFLYLLPNGFSYPTTITMAFFRSAYSVAYIPIIARKTSGTSKIRVIHDGVRFFIIILKIGALFSPMRLFLPVSLISFVTGALYYTYTYIMFGRFTNMSALLFIASMLSFLIGIVAEQVSSLHYKDAAEDRAETK